MEKTYSELISLPTFKERFLYAKVPGQVADETLGHLRYLSQMFYKSKEWFDIRDYVIERDACSDLAVKGMLLDKYVTAHHLKPLTVEDYRSRSKYLLDPKYLITTCHATHNAIHYGKYEDVAPITIVERRPFDTCPWR